MHLISEAINTIMWLLFPLILLGAFGVMAGQKPSLSFRPLTLLLGAMVKGIIAGISWIIEHTLNWLAVNEPAPNNLKQRRQYEQQYQSSGKHR